jgi:acetoin utilization deacetylase AcuC-like enzyme
VSATLLAIEQRPGSGDAQAWILDERGRRMQGHDHGRRMRELSAGLVAHAGVRTVGADASDELLRETLATLHEPAYLQALTRDRSGEAVLLSEFAAPGMAPDTPVSADVAASAFEGARTAITAAQRIVAGARYAYALCRPPGHHAGPNWLGGLCYLNNAAAAVQTLRDAGAGPVAIVDVDIHYPNGTSAMAVRMSDTSLHSLHAHPVVNSPSQSAEPKTTRERLVAFAEPPCNREYLTALAGEIEVLSQSASVVVLSLGYDTVRGDPHGGWSFEPETFTSIGRLLAAAELPVCVVQEGGYALDSLAACSHAFAGGLLGGEAR